MPKKNSTFSEILDEIDRLLYDRKPEEALRKIKAINISNLTAGEFFDYKLLLGETYSENNMTDEAIECFSKVLKMSDILPDDKAHCYGYLADLFYEKEAYNKTVDFALKAINLEQRRNFSIDAYVRLALAYNQLKDYGKSAFYYEELIKKFYPPKNDEENDKLLSAYVSLILIYWFLGKPDRSEEWFRRIKTEKGVDDYPETLINAYAAMGSIYYQLKNYERAIVHFRVALNIAKKYKFENKASEIEQDIRAIPR